MKKLFFMTLMGMMVLAVSADARPRSADYDDEESYVDEDDGGYSSSKKNSRRDRYESDDDDYANVDEDDGSSRSRSRGKRGSRIDDDDEYANVDEDDNSSRSRKRGKRGGRDDSDEEDDSYEDVGYKDMDADKRSKKKEDKGDFFAEDLHMGMHLAIGYAGIWGSELAHGIYLTSGTLEEGDKDPYVGNTGVMGELGFALNYHLGRLFSLVPEVNVRFIDYFKESEAWFLVVYDQYGTITDVAALEENMLLVDINVPIILRVTPVPVFFIDLGVELNVNVSSKFTLSNDDYDYEEDMGGYWATETFKWGVVFGLGTTQSLAENMFFDIGARVVVDMSRIEKEQLVDMTALNGTYRNPVGAKTWAIELVINGYMF